MAYKRVTFREKGTTHDNIQERVVGRLNRFFGETPYAYSWVAKPDEDSQYGEFTVFVSAFTPPIKENVLDEDMVMDMGGVGGE